MVSGWAPAKFKRGRAKKKAKVDKSREASVINSRDCRSVRLALSRSFSPRRRETTAVMPTFKDMKRASTIKRGWFVSPTAAMAAEPSTPTMMVSAKLTRAMRKDSHMEGQAMRNRLPSASLASGKGCPTRSFSLTKTCGLKKRSMIFGKACVTMHLLELRSAGGMRAAQRGAKLKLV